MNDEEKQLLRVQRDMERWAQIKHWISEELCIGCGGDPTVKLYVHFCDHCLYDAGVKIVEIDVSDLPPNNSGEHPPPDDDSIGLEWMVFAEKLFALKDKRRQT